jgi:hypothetical protein
MLLFRVNIYFLIHENVIGIQVSRHEASREICIDIYPSDTFPVKSTLME